MNVGHSEKKAITIIYSSIPNAWTNISADSLERYFLMRLKLCKKYGCYKKLHVSLMVKCLCPPKYIPAHCQKTWRKGGRGNSRQIRIPCVSGWGGGTGVGTASCCHLAQKLGINVNIWATAHLPFPEPNFNPDFLISWQLLDKGRGWCAGVVSSRAVCQYPYTEEYIEE